MQTSWRPFVWVSAALCIGTMGTALASPLYPLYQVLWDLQPSEITYIFIAYMAGVLVALLLLGKKQLTTDFYRSLREDWFFLLSV